MPVKFFFRKLKIYQSILYNQLDIFYYFIAYNAEKVF